VKKSGIMVKEPFQLEFVLKKASPHLLWNLISTPSGLSEWFADDVDERDGMFTFHWDGSSLKAVRIAKNNGTYIKFRWCDEPENCHFELRIDQSDITGDTVLRVTDYADASELNSSIELWNTQVDILSRRTGL